MGVDLDGLNECEWILKTAYESGGQIRYLVHKEAITVGGQQAKGHSWVENVKVLEVDGHIELTRKGIGILTYTLTRSGELMAKDIVEN